MEKIATKTFNFYVDCTMPGVFPGLRLPKGDILFEIGVLMRLLLASDLYCKHNGCEGI